MPETPTEEPKVITEYETMMYKRRGKVAYIMFNRPQALNAVNDQFEEDLHSALLEFDLDDEAWVAIVHGAGRSFCAGADIKQRFVAMTPEQSARRERGPNPEGYMGRSINWKPVIAAVHGYALGAGIVIAAESDMIVASERPNLGQGQRLHALQDSLGDGDNRRTHRRRRTVPAWIGQPPGAHGRARESRRRASGEGVEVTTVGHSSGSEANTPSVGPDRGRSRHADAAPETTPDRGLQRGQSVVRGKESAGVPRPLSGLAGLAANSVRPRTSAEQQRKRHQLPFRHAPNIRPYPEKVCADRDFGSGIGSMIKTLQVKNGQVPSFLNVLQGVRAERNFYFAMICGTVER